MEGVSQSLNLGFQAERQLRSTSLSVDYVRTRATQNFFTVMIFAAAYTVGVWNCFQSLCKGVPALCLRVSPVHL